MGLYKSARERKLWIMAMIVMIAIFASIGLASRLAETLRDHGLISIGFWIGIALVALTVIIQGLRIKPGKVEVFAWVGIAAIYLLVFLRMHVPEERSHLIEYSVLAVIIFEALLERRKQGSNIKYPAFLAWILASSIGVLDELVQLLVPFRVFDPVDIFFNTLAAFMAISSSALLSWIKRKITS